MKRFGHARTSPRARGAALAVLLPVLIACLSASPAGAEALPEHTARLAREYRAQLALGGKKQALGVALSKGGEVWHAAADAIAVRLQAQDSREFLKNALDAYHLGTAQNPDTQSMQLYGLNLLYQSVDALAFLLARTNRDQAALNAIKATEQRVISVVGQSGPKAPAMGAMSGGVMTMLAVVAGQVDKTSPLVQILGKEFDRRRQVDAAIAQAKHVSPEQRLMLLSNNHIHGAFSMVEIIGLMRSDDLKPELLSLEKALLDIKDADVEVQIIAGARALAEASFHVVPALDGFPPLPEPRDPPPSGDTDGDPS